MVTTHDNHIQKLSTHLYGVLDIVEVSEDIRNKYWEMTMMKEISTTAARFRDQMSINAPLYVFGSSCEGTTTPGLMSDIDYLNCVETSPVVELVADAPRHGEVLLMVSGEDVKPGYVKLQPVVNGVPQTVYHRAVREQETSDHRGRIFCRHHTCTLSEPSCRNGPAYTVGASRYGPECDYVFALRCRSIPSFADEWLHRARAYNWPSRKQIELMESRGCFLVAVGHPRSVQFLLEWRISFSLQERELMSSLSPTQHKCYVLLKMIKKDIIQPRVGKSISSYHCKTCIFYLIQTSSASMWTRQNLLYCLRSCLKTLLVWVQQENCPNYFIKAENMFDRLDKIVLKKVATVLEDILWSGVGFLSLINCDKVYNLLQRSIRGQNITNNGIEVKYTLTCGFYTSMSVVLLNGRLQMYQHVYGSRDQSTQISRALGIIQYLKETDILTEHTVGDVRRVLDPPIPHLHLQIAQIIAAIAVKTGDEDVCGATMQAFAQAVQNSEKCDLISSRLITATLCFHKGRYETCDRILQSCEADIAPHVISICGCENYLKYGNEALRKRLITRDMSYIEFRSSCTCTCMIFHPSQSILLHPVLQMEMLRSVNTPPGSRNYFYDFWFDWIVIDSKVYLYFLQYVLYTHTKYIDRRVTAVNNLMRLITTDPNFGHRETAYNLLGWMYVQEDRTDQAVMCFRRSWDIRPVHNAAKWHVLKLSHKTKI